MPAIDRIGDVRTEIPHTRHQLILDTFASLDADTAFVLVNLHDPKQLYHQLAAENAGEFSRDSLMQGPEIWQLRSAGLLQSKSREWPQTEPDLDKGESDERVPDPPHHR